MLNIVGQAGENTYTKHGAVACISPSSGYDWDLKPQNMTWSTTHAQHRNCESGYIYSVKQSSRFITHGLYG